MKWINITGQHDCPPIDNSDFPKEYIVRAKGDDPRSGWVAMSYLTAVDMWDFCKNYEFSQYLDESIHANSVLQDWVMKLPLRAQGTLMTAVRGCDDEAKVWHLKGVAYSPGRRLTAFIRWCFMVPADPREVDSQEGAFMMSTPPNPFKPSEFGHLPQHWYSHAMHALEVVAFCHPEVDVKVIAYRLYQAMVHNMHLNVERDDQMFKRLTEDRFEAGTVVS